MAGEPEEAVHGGFDPAAARRSALRIALLILAVCLIVLLAPGLHELRDRIGEAEPGWLAVAVAMEALSGLSYVLMLKPVFMPLASWADAQRVGWAQLGMGSIVPSSGVAGLALGAWIFNRAGADPKVIAQRSVAFYLIKGAANFVAVAVIGLLLFVGVGHPDISPWLTLFPAVISIALMTAIVLVPRLGPGDAPDAGAGRPARLWSSVRRGLIGAVGEAGEIVRRRQPGVYLGAAGYWFFDNAVLLATFAAFDAPQPVLIVLMGYLIGQLGGLIPAPGGIGGIDAGLIGTFVVYGVPLEAAFVAVLAYRVILFWLPLVLGAIAFAAVQRRLRQINAGG